MRIKFVKPEGEKCVAFSWVVSKSTLDLFIFLYYFEIEIKHTPKDWMVYKGTMKLKDGRKFSVYEKNERYKSLKFHSFVSSTFVSSK